MEYLKINTLFQREQSGKKKGRIIENVYADPIFPNIKKWRVCEKVDGTNVRIIYYPVPNRVDYEVPTKVYFDGRTDNAQLPSRLFNYLKDYFTEVALGKLFDKTIGAPKQVILFGEGYGNNINNNRYKVEFVQFILFDVWIDGWWLERKNVVDIAYQLGIHAVPEIGVMTEKQIIKHVKSEPNSKFELLHNVPAEGIVATAEPMVLNRSGHPVKFKLKVSDYDVRPGILGE